MSGFINASLSWIECLHTWVVLLNNLLICLKGAEYREMDKVYPKLLIRQFEKKMKK